MREQYYYVYILASATHRIHIGITDNLIVPVYQRRRMSKRGCSSKYNTHRLVYYEIFHSLRVAEARRTTIKNWQRHKISQLIERVNPQWRDYAEGWFETPAESVTEQPVTPPETTARDVRQLDPRSQATDGKKKSLLS